MSHMSHKLLYLSNVTTCMMFFEQFFIVYNDTFVCCYLYFFLRVFYVRVEKIREGGVAPFGTTPVCFYKKNQVPTPFKTNHNPIKFFLIKFKKKTPTPSFLKKECQKKFTN